MRVAQGAQAGREGKQTQVARAAVARGERSQTMHCELAVCHKRERVRYEGCAAPRAIKSVGGVDSFRGCAVYTESYTNVAGGTYTYRPAASIRTQCAYSVASRWRRPALPFSLRRRDESLSDALRRVNVHGASPRNLAKSARHACSWASRSPARSRYARAHTSVNGYAPGSAGTNIRRLRRRPPRDRLRGMLGHPAFRIAKETPPAPM